MERTRSLARSGALLAVLSLPGVAAAAQPGSGGGPGLWSGIGIRFVAGLLLNLVLGGALIAFASRYARERVDEVNRRPGATFVWGLAVGLGGAVLVVALAITVIGLLVAIPGAIGLVVVGLVGNAVTVVWLGDLVVRDEGDPGVAAVAVGALLLAALGAVPVLGNPLTTLAGTFGLGAVGRELVRSWKGGSGRPARSRGGPAPAER